jgi:hypothetical protein
MIQRNTQIFFPGWRIFVMFRGIDAARPLHPIAHHTHTEEEGNDAYKRADNPGRFAEEEGTKNNFATGQRADTCNKEPT